MVDPSDLTTRQREVINQLPAGKEEISNHVGVAPTTVKDHIKALRERGVDIEYDREANVYCLVDEAKVRRVSTKHTGSKTREANNYITEIERTVLRRLKKHDKSVTSHPSEPGNEDMVLFVSDVHIGDVVENEYGREVYNSSVAEEVVDHITRRVLELKEQYTIADFDTIHLLYGGDIITNENIYDGQAFDIREMLSDQMTTAVSCLTRQIKEFAQAFESVNVICQPGNHGKTRASGVSKQANMDLVVYRWVDDRIRESPYYNIEFRTGEATWFRTFELRDWSGFLTHGQDSLEHIGTSSGRNRWRGWLNEHDFDVAYRGHYHESKREPIQNGPMIFEAPSPKPSDEWTSKIGYGSVDGTPKRLAQLHGVSDKRPITWETTIDEIGMA